MKARLLLDGERESPSGGGRGGAGQAISKALTKTKLRAYIGPEPGPPDEVQGRYTAILENEEVWTSGILESHDGELAEVIAWARERTGWALVVEEPMMWAGTDPVPDEEEIKRVWRDGGAVDIAKGEHQDSC